MNVDQRVVRALLILSLPVAFLAAGCATTARQNDPAEGGLFRAVQGVSGGQYEERRRQREEELQRQREIGNRLDARLADLDDEQNELEAEIRRLVDSLDDINESIERGMRQLERVEGDRSEIEERFRAAQLKVFDLRHTLADEEVYTQSEIHEIGQSVAEIEELVVQLTAEL